MKEPKKLGLVGKLILGAGAIASIFSGSAKAGNFEVRHHSTKTGIEKQVVNINDNCPDGVYNPPASSSLIAYIKDINNNPLSIKGIDPNETDYVPTVVEGWRRLHFISLSCLSFFRNYFFFICQFIQI